MIIVLKRGPADGIQIKVCNYRNTFLYQCRVPVPVDFIEKPTSSIPVHVYRRVPNTNIYYYERVYQ